MDTEDHFAWDVIDELLSDIHQAQRLVDIGQELLHMRKRPKEVYQPYGGRGLRELPRQPVPRDLVGPHGRRLPKLADP